MSKSVTVILTEAGNITTRSLKKLSDAGVLVVTAYDMLKVKVVHIGDEIPTAEHWQDALKAINSSKVATENYGQYLINQLTRATK